MRFKFAGTPLNEAFEEYPELKKQEWLKDLQQQGTVEGLTPLTVQSRSSIIGVDLRFNSPNKAAEFASLAPSLGLAVGELDEEYLMVDWLKNREGDR